MLVDEDLLVHDILAVISQSIYQGLLLRYERVCDHLYCSMCLSLLIPVSCNHIPYQCVADQ